MSSSHSGSNRSESIPRWRSALAGIVSIAALIGFGLFAVYLLNRVESGELHWTRSMYLLKGVEGIAVAAVGWLFGREVHRERAEAAEDRARAAQQAAGEAKDQAAQARADVAAAHARGHSLAAAVKAHARAAQSHSGAVRLDEAEGARGTAGSGGGTDGLATLADLAEQLYPSSPSSSAP